MTFDIRPPTPADRAEYLRMRLALWPDLREAAHAAAEGETWLVPRPGRIAFVAARPDGRLCGFAELALRPWAQGIEARPAPYLEGLYVDPEFRRHGVARALVAAGETWALEMGALALGSDTEVENTVSQAVHTRLGFREVERLVGFLKPLDGTPRAPETRQGSLLADIPATLSEELVTTLVAGAHMRVERIVSRGHASPPGFWYDQDEDELVLLVAGAARVEVEGRGEVSLRPGDWLDLPKYVRHRVAWTAPDTDTVWLAVFRGG